MFSPLVDQLIGALRVLPGVGPKSAQRMALQLLERNRPGATALARALTQAVEQVGFCQSCRTLSEQPLCSLCANPRRDQQLLCVVESPGDVFALEQAGSYSGQYFVLHGRLSPIDGMGPNELALPQLMERLQQGVNEVIIATSLTMEGEATAHYIAEKAKAMGVTVTRIAHGVPLGGELEYIDGGTLAHALNTRRAI